MVRKKSVKDKIASIYKICSAMQARTGMSDEKKERCIKAIKVKWGVKKAKKKKKG